MSRTVFTCEPGREAALVAELRRTLPDRVSVAAECGFAAADGIAPETEPTVAFSDQCLVDAEPCEARSISEWAEAACRQIIERLDAVATPWRLHVFGTPRADGSTGHRRSQLVAARIDELLRDRRRRLAKRRSAEPDAPWRGGEALVQVLLTTPTTGFTSVCDSAARLRLRRVVSRFVAGGVEPPVDKRAPSRAFAKLIEVERRLNRPIAAGETCVDLGSSPGSWAYTALGRGATVTAVDRSPLRDDLMRNPRLSFVRGDAFRFRPAAPVDWLLSDVIAFPARAGELLAAWLGERLCRRFCVTIKFRGRDDDAELEPIKQLLVASEYEFCLRRLNANKNEATAYGTLHEAADTTSDCLA